MTGLSRFDFYPRDWISGTRGLSDRAKGIYVDLLCRMYDLGRPLDYDIKDLCRFLGYRDRRQLDTVLAELIQAGKIIVTDDDRLTNERFAKEIAAANRHIENSRKGGHAKAEKARKKVTERGQERVLEPILSRSQGPSFEKKQALNPCLPSPSPSKKKNLSKESGKAAYWIYAKSIAEKSERPEQHVRSLMGRFLNFHDGDLPRATEALQTCVEKNDPLTYMSSIIERLKAGPPKRGGVGFNGPYQRSQEDADYLASLDPCRLDPGEESLLEDIRREQPGG